MNTIQVKFCTNPDCNWGGVRPWLVNKKDSTFEHMKFCGCCGDAITNFIEHIEVVSDDGDNSEAQEFNYWGGAGGTESCIIASEHDSLADPRYKCVNGCEGEGEPCGGNWCQACIDKVRRSNYEDNQVSWGSKANDDTWGDASHISDQTIQTTMAPQVQTCGFVHTFANGDNGTGQYHGVEEPVLNRASSPYTLTYDAPSFTRDPFTTPATTLTPSEEVYEDGSHVVRGRTWTRNLAERPATKKIKINNVEVLGRNMMYPLVTIDESNVRNWNDKLTRIEHPTPTPTPRAGNGWSSYSESSAPVYEIVRRNRAGGDGDSWGNPCPAAGGDGWGTPAAPAQAVAPGW